MVEPKQRLLVTSGTTILTLFYFKTEKHFGIVTKSVFIKV